MSNFPRLIDDLKDVARFEDGLGVLAIPVNPSNSYHLIGTICGVAGTPFEGGVFEIDIRIPVVYPFKPPNMRFKTKIWHPKICSKSGDIYADFLQDRWYPAFTIKSALLSIRRLLSSIPPDLDDSPQNTEAAEMYRNRIEEYNQMAKFWTNSYAKEISWENAIARVCRSSIDGVRPNNSSMNSTVGTNPVIPNDKGRAVPPSVFNTISPVLPLPPNPPWSPRFQSISSPVHVVSGKSIHSPIDLGSETVTSASSSVRASDDGSEFGRGFSGVRRILPPIKSFSRSISAAQDATPTVPDISKFGESKSSTGVCNSPKPSDAHPINHKRKLSSIATPPSDNTPNTVVPNKKKDMPALCSSLLPPPPSSPSSPPSLSTPLSASLPPLSLQKKASYRWVGGGKTITTVTTHLDTSTSTHYSALELHNMKYNQNNPLITVKIGDTVLIRRPKGDGDSLPSSPSPYGPITASPRHKSSKYLTEDGQPSSSSATCNTTTAKKQRTTDKNQEKECSSPKEKVSTEVQEEDDTLNSTLKIASRTELSMETIDPFIGRVEDLWEEEIQDVGARRRYPKPNYKITKRLRVDATGAPSTKIEGANNSPEYEYEVVDVDSDRVTYLRAASDKIEQCTDQIVVPTIPSQRERCRHISMDDSRCKHMKMRVRWFLKKEDVVSLEGKFIGVSSRETLLSSMKPQNLILLEDQTNVIEVSTILSKCSVVSHQHSSSPESSLTTSPATSTRGLTIDLTTDDVSSQSTPPQRTAAFSCRYKVSTQPATGDSAGQKRVILNPYVDVQEDGDKKNKEDAGTLLSSSQIKSPTKKRAHISLFDGDSNGDAGSDKLARKRDTQQVKGTTIVNDQDRKLTACSSPVNMRTSVTLLESDNTSTEIADRTGENIGDKGKAKTAKVDRSKSTVSANEITTNNLEDTHSSKSIPPVEEMQQASSKKTPADLPSSTAFDETGTTVGKIKLGPAHQAIIPHMNKRRKYTPSRPTITAAKMTWKPNSISDGDLDLFVLEAAKLLKELSDEHQMQLTMMDHHIVRMGKPDEGVNAHLSSSSFGAVKYREFNKEAILALLHECHYDTSAALESLSKDSLEKYLTLWTKEEQELYNAGFHTHLNSLGQISKGIHTKSHKDIIDYHYRFKIPDQFKRYQRKKFEQAQRMMECIERRRSDEVMRKLYKIPSESQVQNTGGGSSNSSSGGLRKNHEWTKTGGGVYDAIGATERRRLDAKDLLISIQKELGEKKYRTIVDYLKKFQSHSFTVPQVKAGFMTELERHPTLLTKFLSFLPGPLRKNNEN